MENIKKIEEHLDKNYLPDDGGKTSQTSEGNGDDQFEDGFARGYAVALKEIADILEIKIEPLAEQDFN